jgi:hypothetical protein
MLRGLFARKFEQERWAKVEFSQTIDEQRIVLVGRVPNKWSKNSSHRLIESVLFHLSARSGRNSTGSAALTLCLGCVTRTNRC